MSVRHVPPVIVGVDGSPIGNAALDAAADQAAARGVPLEIMHSYPYPPVYGPMPGAPYAYEYGEPPAAVVEILTGAEQRALSRHPALTIATHLIRTSPAGWLVEQSAEAALVVVGARGTGGFSGLLLGAVPGQVATHAACPVMVVRGGAHRPANAPVLVGADGTEHSAAALDFAFAEASRRGVALRVLSVWQADPQLLARDEFSPSGDTAAADVAHRVLSESLAGYRERYPDVQVVPFVSYDRYPAEILLEESARAGLVVAGSRGRGELASLLLGSVGYTLIHHADCPVVIARTPKD
ncbi:universal stress protein [Longispora albida]|uniref:universal stress protein n=1 Tax=Longispora albida TaxID=203523 RepID=UPI0003618771|nr:universal stress protein [Longispora albida]